MDFRRYYSPLILPGTAIFALLWAIARACVQSITIDEADTYLVWVARHDPSHWQARVQQSHAEFAADAAVHVGLRGEPFVRAGSGATGRGALYSGGVPALPEADAGPARAVAGVRLPGLQPVRLRPSGGRPRIRAGARISDVHVRRRRRTCDLDVAACALCSVCAALSFAANFSFAFVNVFAMLAILTWACARTQATRARVRLLGACVLPGLLVSVFLSVPAVLHWPKGE